MNKRIITLLLMVTVFFTMGLTFSNQEVHAATHKHSYKVVKCKEATCTKEGYKIKKCKTCNKTVKVKMCKTGHKWKCYKTVASTCVKAGTKHYRCTVCKTVKKVSVKKKPHNMKVTSTTSKSSGCKKTITTKSKCTKCSYKKTSTKNTYIHQFKLTATKLPTYNTSGYKKYKCSKCGKVNTTIQVSYKEKFKHVPDGGKITISKENFTIETIYFPKKSDFAEHYDNALKFTDAIYAGQNYVLLTHSSDEKEMEFWKLIRKHVVHYSDSVGRGKSSDKPIKYVYDIRNLSSKLKKEMVARDYVYNKCFEAGLKNGMTKKEAVIKINKWEIDNLSYCRNNLDYYDAFLCGKGQCYAYARMMLKMCQVCNIEADTVVDPTNTHEWAKVKLNNTWYHVDPCWNDSSVETQYMFSTKIWDNHYF